MADQNAKINSSERFLWAENLTKLVINQPDEEATIETIVETPQPTEPENEVITEIEEANNLPIPKIDDPSLEIIERLTCQQIQELTEDISNLLKIDLNEDEQFSFIQTRSTVNRSNTKMLEGGKTN